MAVDRVVQAVDDDVEEIETVSFLRITDAPSQYKDPFNAQNEEIKSLGNLDANTKRRVTNQINKYARSEDGKTSSKRLEDKDSITAYDAFGVVVPPHNLDYLAKLYEVSAAHKAAVDAKVANIVGLGYNFVETRKTKRALEDLDENEKKKKKVVRGLEEHKEDLENLFESFNEEDTFQETLNKVWKDYETTGNGYIEVGRKKDGSIGYVGHIPAQTMRIRRLRDGFVQISAAKTQFFRNFGDKKTSNPIGSYSTNEVIHLKKYSPASAFYGVPDIIAAKQAVAGMKFANDYNLDYFENKAVPRHVITLKGAKLGPRAEVDLLQFFEPLRGVHHRSIFVPLPPDTKDNKVEFKIEPIETGVQDGSFGNYGKRNLMDILMVHRVPLTKVSVGEGINLALAKDADKTFKEQVCAPEQKVAEKKINKITKELTEAFELKLNEMTLTDADTQSKIDERMVKAGIWLPNEPRTRDGKPAIDGGNERVDLNAKDKIAQQQAEATAQRERDSARSAGSTDNAGEARNPKGEGRTTS